MALLALSIISPDIYSQLSFFFSFLTGFPATSISHLQSILHNAARVIFLKSPFDHVIPLLKTLLRFPVICRISGYFTWGPRKPCPAPTRPWLAPPSPSLRAFLLSHSASALCTLSFALFPEFVLFSLSPSGCRVTYFSFTKNLCRPPREEALTTFFFGFILFIYFNLIVIR